MRTETTNYNNSQGDSSFLTAPFFGKNAFWRYFIGTVTPFLVSNTIGAIPLIVVMAVIFGRQETPHKRWHARFCSHGNRSESGVRSDSISLYPGLLCSYPHDQTTEPEELRDCGERRKGDQMGKNIFLGTGLAVNIGSIPSLVSKK